MCCCLNDVQWYLQRLNKNEMFIKSNEDNCVPNFDGCIDSGIFVFQM